IPYIPYIPFTQTKPTPAATAAAVAGTVPAVFGRPVSGLKIRRRRCIIGLMSPAGTVPDRRCDGITKQCKGEDFGVQVPL
ncbi:MAG: hypothetical protein ACKOEO_02185, partial [Planctomycetaceae bacterium]